MPRVRVSSIYAKPILERRWIPFPPFPAVHTSSQAFGTAGRVYLCPVDVPWRVEIDAIGYYVGDTAAGNVRIGLYKEGAEDTPEGGDLVCESGSEAQPTAYCFHLLTVPDTILNPGRYWVALQGDDTTGTFMRAVRLLLNTAWLSRSYDHTYGPFEDPCPSVSAQTFSASGVLRVKRVLA